MNQEQIEQLVTELCQENSSFKGKESAVRELITQLAASKPDALADPNFKNQLRQQLIHESHIVKPTLPSFRSMYPWIAGGLVVVLAVAAYPTYRYYQNQRTLPIARLNEKAFGSLSLQGLTDSASRSASGTTPMTISTLDTNAETSPDTPASPSLMLPTSVRYVYAGPALAQNEATLAVYRRTLSIGPLANDLFKNNSAFFKNNSAWSNATVQTMGITQGDDLYQAEIDFRSGYLSINFTKSRTEELATTTQLSDEEAITIANQFVDSFKLDRAGYGNPVVVKNVMYATFKDAATDSTPDFQPDISLVYPLTINNRKVYDMSGNLVGMYVTVSPRDRKVHYLSNLHTNPLESSDYEAETDFEKIRQAVQTANTYYGAPEATPEDITVENPELVYVISTQYTNGISQELYVPAYYFKVAEADTQRPPYQKAVVVPIIKEMLQQQGTTSSGSTGTDAIQPMPAEIDRM